MTTASRHEVNDFDQMRIFRSAIRTFTISRASTISRNLKTDSRSTGAASMVTSHPAVPLPSSLSSH